MNCDNFPEICGEDYDPFKINLWYFSFNEYSFIY